MRTDYRPEAAPSRVGAEDKPRRRRRRTPRLLWRQARVAHELDISRRALERLRSAGSFPTPDLHIGRMPLWRPSTVRRWIEGGGRHG